MQTNDDHRSTTSALVPTPTCTGMRRHRAAAPAVLVRATRQRLVRARRATRALASDIGQGTVEYVGLLLLMATVLAAVVAAAGSLGGKEEIGKRVVTQIGKSIDKAGQGNAER